MTQNFIETDKEEFRAGLTGFLIYSLWSLQINLRKIKTETL